MLPTGATTHCLREKGGLVICNDSGECERGTLAFAKSDQCRRQVRDTLLIEEVLERPCNVFQELRTSRSASAPCQL